MANCFFRERVCDNNCKAYTENQTCRLLMLAGFAAEGLHAGVDAVAIAKKMQEDVEPLLQASIRIIEKYEPLLDKAIKVLEESLDE
jgi:hypothetical protein